MELSVDNICSLLIRSRLLPVATVQALLQAWRNEAKEAAGDCELFIRWLVAREYLTEYQAGGLSRGHVDHFFLNEYKLLDRIGKGRMAGVYKAVHSDGQTYAIKVLPPSKAKDAELFARFQREARLAMRLKHPNVVQTVDEGQTEKLHYIVMEYLDGETLEEVLQRRGKLPPKEAAQVVYQVLVGLQHLYEADIVHRDLKPANLMLLPGRESGQPDTTLGSTIKILDIGLGRALFDEGDSTGGPILVTNDGAALGTPEYQAPEQARDAHRVDIRADIYSLGCVLYHALAGQPPFREANSVRLLLRHATEAPPPLKKFTPAVPDELQTIVSTMLAKDPALRYTMPGEAARDLQAFLAGADQPRPAAVAVARAVPAKSGDRPKPLAAEKKEKVVLVPLAPTPKTPGPSSGAETLPFMGQDPQPSSSVGKSILLLAIGGGLAALVGVVLLTGVFSNPSRKKTDPSADVGGTTRDKSNSFGNNDSEEPDPRPAGKPKRPVPDEAAQKKAADLFKALFMADYAGTRPAERRALAMKLLEHGVNTEDDFCARFVLLREARDVAARAGEIALALEAADALAKEYAIDGLGMKTAALSTAGQVAATPAAHHLLAETALALHEEAIALDQHDLALRLAGVARTAARKAEKKEALVRRVDALEQELRAIQKEYKHARHAAAVLRKQPKDPDANLAVGKFLSFMKGKWLKGLPLLARGSDETLKALAAQDLGRPKKPTAQVQLADGWWDQGQKEAGPARRQQLARASYWYRQALPLLTGIPRTRTEKRLEELEADPEVVNTYLGMAPKAVRFKESNNVELAGSKGLLPANGNFTVELWVRWRPAAEEPHYLMGDIAWPNMSPLIAVKQEGGWLLRTTRLQEKNRGLVLTMFFTMKGKPQALTLRGDLRPDSGQWQHLAVSKTNHLVRIFWNGKLYASQSCLGMQLSPSVTPLYLGVRKHAPSDPQFQGDIRAVRLSSRARYPQDFIPVRRLARQPDTLVLLDFSTGQGKQLSDLSGGKHHGILEGPEWIDPSR